MLPSLAREGVRDLMPNRDGKFNDQVRNLVVLGKSPKINSALRRLRDLVLIAYCSGQHPLKGENRE
jgi:hypothetical protein